MFYMGKESEITLMNKGEFKIQLLKFRNDGPSDVST